MKLIAVFFSWLAPAITGWAIAFFGRKLLVATASIVLFVSITAVFIITIKSVISSVLALAVLPSWVSLGVGMFVPDNFAFVFGAILSAQVSRFVYDKAVEKIHLINGAA